MIYLGIDPGKSGAIAEIWEGEGDLLGWRIAPIPIISAVRGRGKDEYDVAGVNNLLREWVRMEDTNNCLAVIEKPQPIPPTVKAGSLAQFNRGVQVGFAWMLEALRIPYELVAPRTWQRIMHGGTPGDDTKQRSIIAAQRLFPGVDLRRSPRARKADDGFADALLLAEYARRINNGGARNG